MSTKSTYLMQCANVAQSFRATPKSLLRYCRDRRNRKVGVVLAYRGHDGVIRIGFSKCHVEREPFDREVGITKAFERSVPLHELQLPDVPQSIRNDVLSMKERAERYYRVS